MDHERDEAVSDSGAVTTEPCSVSQMDERTLVALKGSIAKWEAIVAGTGEDKGCLNCPLCQEFYKVNCDGCPVKAHTRSECCGNTPYPDYADAIAEGKREPAALAAQAELDFLKSLLPEQDRTMTAQTDNATTNPS